MIGKTISHYRITEKLGEGGMGIVYRATDLKLDRSVALKLLSAHLASDADARSRFVREAKAAATLMHPNVCVVHEIDEVEGDSFIAMEYLEGESLAEKIKKRPLPLDEALDITNQVAGGLQAAHEKGIDHRDIKPANIMIDVAGRAKILDFGLAHLEEVTRVTKTGTSIGTPAYMSPEQVRGEKVDHRTDIWSLGVVIYEMVTGQIPFRGEIPEAVSHSILYEEPESLTALRAGVPMELDRVVGKALAKDRQQRYQHVDEMLVDLRVLLTSYQAESKKSAPSPAKPVQKPRVLVHAGVVMLGVLLVALGLFLVGRRDAGAPRAASIAVLPLDNLSNNPEEDYFTDGLTEALIADLAKISSLTVISRTSVMGFKNSTQPLPEIARQLNVGYIVEGSALRVGDRVRVTAQLIEASSDRHRWAETYERDVRDILTLQSEVARTIAQEIRVRLTPEEEVRLTRTAQVKTDAYDAYLKGQFYWFQQAFSSVERSIEYYQEAIALDPEYAPAYAGLAKGYRMSTFVGLGSGKELLPKAREAARKALELDDTLADAQMAGAANAAMASNWSEAERGFKRAIELNPSHSQAHNVYAMLCLVPLGRLDEALGQILISLELDPLALFNSVQVGQVYLFRREYDEAIKQSLQTLEMDPNFAMAYWMLGRAYMAAGMHNEAVAAHRKAVALVESNLNLASLGNAYALSGNKEEAYKVLDKLRERPQGGYVASFAVALVYLGLGERDHALDWLEEAYTQREPWLLYLNVDPAYDSVRSDPRFAALLRKVNLNVLP